MQRNKVDKSFQFRETPETNRAHNIKDENGLSKMIPSISIYDIDYAILWQLQKGFALRVQQGEEAIQVPAVIADAEKWTQIQRYGFLRGKSRQLLAPMIVLKRKSMVEDDRFVKLDIPNGQKLIYIPPKNTANRYNNLDRAYNTNESQEYIVSVIPEHVRVEYEILIWTNFQTQLNHIVQQIIPFNNIPWGDQFQFNTKFETWNFETINNAGEDRAVKATNTLTVDGILQNEYTVHEKDVQTAFSIKRVEFKNEYEQEDFIVDHRPETISIRNRKVKPVAKI